MSRNEITGDKLQSKIGNSEAYSKGYDAIFSKSEQVRRDSQMSFPDLGEEEDDDDEEEEIVQETCFHWVAGYEALPID